MVATSPTSLLRLHRPRFPAAVYAIGDVHGCHDSLIALERQVLADATRIDGDKLIVMLGDYVDRGPRACQVIDHLLAPPPRGFERICLRGNHEQMMLDFLADPETHGYWLDEGGHETLASYGIDPDAASDSAARLPSRHVGFLAGLPFLLELPGLIFVHAGIRPGVPLDRQDNEDLIWIREPFLSSDGLPGYRVVHGHTPVDEPEITPARIGIDTRCYATGRLTALRVTADGETAFITTEG